MDNLNLSGVGKARIPCGVLLVVVAACSEEPPALSLNWVEPMSARTGEETQVRLVGAGFTPAVYISYREPERSSVDSRFEAKLGDRALTGVTYQDAELLVATVPPDLAPGKYALTVRRPDGEEASLADAFEVLSEVVGPDGGPIELDGGLRDGGLRDGSLRDGALDDLLAIDATTTDGTSSEAGQDAAVTDGPGDDAGCLESSQRACGSDVGECRHGQQTCSGGSWGPCLGGVAPSPELCDGLDNDCDPSTADGAAEPLLGASCDGADLGDCREGTWICSDDALVCDDDSGDDVEGPAGTGSCFDSVDNDCDGLLNAADGDCQVQLVDDQLLLHLDAARARGGLEPQLAGCAVGDLTWTDLSSSGADGNLLNFASCDVDSGWSGAGTTTDPYRLVFRGSDDNLVDLGRDLFNAVGQGTLEAWYRMDTPPPRTGNDNTSGYGLLSAASTSDNLKFFAIDVYADAADDPRLNAWCRDPFNVVHGEHALASATWQHLAVSSDGVETRQYINAVEENATAITGNDLGDWFEDSAAGEMIYTVGRVRRATTDNTFVPDDSALAILRLHGRALSSAELLANCQAEAARFAGATCGP